MDSACLCPSPPPKILVADKLRPNEQTTAYMAAHGCHFVECSLYVLLVIIESFSSQRATRVSAQPFLYKTGPPILSRTFSKNNLRTRVRVGFDNSTAWLVALRSWNLICKAPEFAFMNHARFRCLPCGTKQLNRLNNTCHGLVDSRKPEPSPGARQALIQ